eukprot:gnl/MRDRNA2_/MRDRNA2_92009_c0_seq1.p1 gnl/MRDRNA2_/MRDRNA2_92009_c0~~gnl/MRDRNA2_/MRDRNA2_92009_c0_seq1.p1  ORF type:complete len:422 (+),score=47.07 gnl/MRDRNA2_/MRDRNA2_92009_c0_seq1:92-1357(+)
MRNFAVVEPEYERGILESRRVHYHHWDSDSDLGSDELFSHRHLSPLGNLLEAWYRKFTIAHTCKYVTKVAAPPFIFYSLWATFWWHLAEEKPELSKQMQADAALKILCFLVGLLISFTLKESLDRYKECLAALIAFRDEFRSFWYFSQMQLLYQPAARILVDIHMVFYAVSLVRFLLSKANVAKLSFNEMVQPEFRRCVLFQEDGTYDSLCNNPAYAELILVSWLRALGQMNRDLQNRFKWARQKLSLLLTAQRVKSPRTSVHLLRTVVHIFLLVVPPFSSSTTTKLSTPIIALLLFALLSLSEELEDPFGMDEHDIPWPVLLGTISHCTISTSSRHHLDEAMEFFNHGAITGSWDEATAKKLLGPQTKVTATKGKRPTGDTGITDLSAYITRPALLALDICGNTKIGNRDVLFSEPREEV